MDDARIHAITALRHEMDGARSVFSGIDASGTAHDVPLLDDAAAIYSTDKQAVRVAIAIIAHQAGQTEPCCC